MQQKWIVLAPYDGQGGMVPKVGEHANLDMLAVFEAAKDTVDEGYALPEAEALSKALAEKLEADGETQELVLVPLDRARTLSVRVLPAVELISTGNLT